MGRVIKRLRPPVLPNLTLERPEVDRAIDAAMIKEVAYIHAPAGFGKTLAMCKWLEKKPNLAAWIPLTVYDGDSAVFCRYLLTALVGFGDGAAKPAQAALDDPSFETAPFEFLFRAISSTSAKSSDGIIVLDDFHLIQNDAIHRALPQIIKKISPMFKMVIMSRQTPPPSFSDMAIKNQIGVVDEHHLRFTKRNIIGLYKCYGIQISYSDAAEIEKMTGGWALGLGARLLSIKPDNELNLLNKSSAEQYIYNYLKSEIWENWDRGTQDFLLKTSVLEDLSPELCDQLCGCNSAKVLSHLMYSSGLVVRLSDGSYRYHHILRDFLRKIAEEQKIDLTLYNIISAEFMLNNGRINAALYYFDKCGDFNVLKQFLIRVADYGIANDSVEGFCESINSLLIKKLPVGAIETNVTILAPCIWASLMLGNYAQFSIWIKKAMPLVYDAQADPQIRAAILVFQFANPVNSASDMLKFAQGNFNELTFERLLSPSITYNFPFFHRSHRDYTYIVFDWQNLIPQYKVGFNAISGGSATIFMNGVESGILYEKNAIKAARECAHNQFNLLDEKTHPELWFSSYLHLAMIALAEGDERGAWDAIHDAKTMIEEKALYLKKNLDAIITKFRLYKGDSEAAHEWLSSYSVSESNTVKFYQLYQAFTTIRAKIAIGEFSAALLLITIVEKLVIEYRRPLDQIEILILRAIIFWKKKDRKVAVDNLNDAILIARPYGYIRIFANEGAAILPILQKLYRRYVVKPEDETISCFVHELLVAATENAEFYPGFTSGFEEKTLRLSKQQKLMLDFLAAGKNSRQICADTGLKLNTVKAHLSLLYQKLEVNNSIDAVLKASQIGILEKKD